MITRTLPRTLLLTAVALLPAACRSEVTTSTPPAPPPVVRELGSPAATGSGEPELFHHADGDGGLILSWVEKVEENRHALRFASYESGGWSPSRTVASGENWFINWADFPAVIKLPDGSLAAHWLVKSAAKKYAYDIRIARSTDGGETWAAPVVPHRDNTPTEHGFVSLLPHPGSGGVAAIWLDGRKFGGGAEEHVRAGEAEIINAAHGGADGADHKATTTVTNEMTLRYAVIGANGKITEETELDGRVCECCQTAAALTADGPIIVYRDRSETEVRDFSVVRLVNGRWTEPRTLHQDGWQINACPVNGASIAARERRVAVAWFTQAGDQPQVKVSFSADAGETFGEPLGVDAGTAVHGRVDVVILDDGSALVSWLVGMGAEGAEIKTRRVHPDGRLGAAMIIARTSAARASGFPRMARVGPEEVVFAWTEPGSPPGQQSRVRTARMNIETPD